jgi:hypothetical protein
MASNQSLIYGQVFRTLNSDPSFLFIPSSAPSASVSGNGTETINRPSESRSNIFFRENDQIPQGIIELPPSASTSPATIIQTNPVNPNDVAFRQNYPGLLAFNRLLPSQSVVTDPTATLNSPFRLCDTGQDAPGRFNTFATYTIAGGSDINRVVDNFDDNSQKILLQIFVDYPTATLTGRFVAVEDKFQNLPREMTDTVVETNELKTLDEIGLKVIEESRFKPIINTECEATVTGKGGFQYVPPNAASALSDAIRLVKNPPFQKCDITPQSELHTALYTIEGFDNAWKGLNGQLGNEKSSFNLQLYNDLITGVMEGVFYLDSDRSSITPVGSGEKDDVFASNSFSAHVTTECNVQPPYNI